MNRRSGPWRNSRFNVTRKTRLPVQHTHPGASRTSLTEDKSGMGELPEASPSRMTALKGAVRAAPAGAGGDAASSSEAMAASRAPALGPVTRVTGTGPANQTPFLASLPGSTPSCLSLRYRWVRSRPVFSATRVMLPPSRPRWCSKYMRSKASRASRSGRSKDSV